MKKTKPFQCQECGKPLTYGEMKAATFRGCPKCGGSDIDIAPLAAPVVAAVKLNGFDG